jgi:hypothetical protein
MSLWFITDKISTKLSSLIWLFISLLHLVCFSIFCFDPLLLTSDTSLAAGRSPEKSGRCSTSASFSLRLPRLHTSSSAGYPYALSNRACIHLNRREIPGPGRTPPPASSASRQAVAHHPEPDPLRLLSRRPAAGSPLHLRHGGDGHRGEATPALQQPRLRRAPGVARAQERPGRPAQPERRVGQRQRCGSVSLGVFMLTLQAPG